MPLIASGGAGAPEHFRDVFDNADVDGALAASVFHLGTIGIPELKRYLNSAGIEVRFDELNSPNDGNRAARSSRLCGSLDWAKGDSLLPAVVQHAVSGTVLMLGYMDREALEATLRDRRVTFYSRSRGRLWTKGETSGTLHRGGERHGGLRSGLAAGARPPPRPGLPHRRDRVLLRAVAERAHTRSPFWIASKQSSRAHRRAAREQLHRKAPRPGLEPHGAKGR